MKTMKILNKSSREHAGRHTCVTQTATALSLLFISRLNFAPKTSENRLVQYFVFNVIGALNV